MSFQITLNQDELDKFEAIVTVLYKEYNWIKLEENNNKVKIQLVLFGEDKADELQETLIQHLEDAHIEEIIGG